MIVVTIWDIITIILIAIVGVVVLYAKIVSVINKKKKK